MEHAVSVATRVAASNVKVLITGESGVGKDVFARLIHSRSARSLERFVALNCAGVAETLLESELFGHVKGSFTGRLSGQDRLFRAGAQRHDLSRRDRGHGAENAGPASPISRNR